MDGATGFKSTSFASVRVFGGGICEALGCVEDGVGAEGSAKDWRVLDLKFLGIKERNRGLVSYIPLSPPPISPAPIPAAPPTAAGAAALLVAVGVLVVGVPCCCCEVCGWLWLWFAFLRPKRPRRPFLTWARASGAVGELVVSVGYSG